MDRTKQEQIQRVAHELYQRRLLLNRTGDAESDWKKAEAVVQKPLQRLLFLCNRHFINLEKHIWEPLLIWADDQALLNLLGIIGNIGILVAVATYIATEKQRRDSEVLNAWQTITSAYSQPGSGGRIQALEFLNASPGANWRRRLICLSICTWPAERLDGINLSVTPVEGQGTTERSNTGVYLEGVELPEARLRSANLQGADLSGSNLQGAYLWSANLQGTYMEWANLQGAYLEKANLQNTSLRGANLQNTSLRGANLQNTSLWGANLQDAYLEEVSLQNSFLWRADLQGTYLREADLQSAYLEETNLQNSVLVATNLENVRNLTVNQLEGEKPPLVCNVNLPSNLTTINPNRDCDRLPQVLVARYKFSLESSQRIIEEAKQKQWD